MQIKSAVILGTGVALGWIFFSDVESKEKAIDSIKRIVYKMQTGESYPRKKMKITHNPEPNFYTTYSQRAQK